MTRSIFLLGPSIVLPTPLFTALTKALEWVSERRGRSFIWSLSNWTTGKIFTKGKTIKQIGPQDSMILSSDTRKNWTRGFHFSLLQHLNIDYTAFPFLKLLLLVNSVVNSVYIFLYFWGSRSVHLTGKCWINLCRQQPWVIFVKGYLWSKPYHIQKS